MSTAVVSGLVTAGSVSLMNAKTYSYDVDFTQRMEIAATAVAHAVLAESTATDGHALRATYARLVMSNPKSYASQSIAKAVVADMITTSAVTDQQLLDRISAVWSDLAGATG